jgi:hydroxymethylpyrimidine pyrophosphatase-like HAD family hydrolase
VSGLAETLRYAVFDLDGTLLGSDGTVSEVTRAGLHRLKRQRFALLVASGRSPYLVEQLRLAPGLLDLFEPIMVLRDGDILWNWTTRTIEEMRRVSETVVPALHAAGVPDFVVDTGSRLVATSPVAAARYALFYRCRRSAIEVSATPPAAPVTKLSVYAGGDHVRRALAGVAGCRINEAPERRRCTIVPSGSCKAAGTAHLLSTVHSEPTLDRVVAFGDGSNDACLLGTVGVGVAMAVSHPDAVQRATIQLRGTLEHFLTEEFSRGGLAAAVRAGRRCAHRA